LLYFYKNYSLDGFNVEEIPSDQVSVNQVSVNQVSAHQIDNVPARFDSEDDSIGMIRMWWFNCLKNGQIRTRKHTIEIPPYRHGFFWSVPHLQLRNSYLIETTGYILDEEESVLKSNGEYCIFLKNFKSLLPGHPKRYYSKQEKISGRKVVVSRIPGLEQLQRMFANSINRDVNTLFG